MGVISEIVHEMQKLRRSVLQHAVGILGGLGMADLTARVLGRSGAIILMYHSVAVPESEHWIDPANQISLGRFRSHLNFLAAHRSVVTLSELVRMLTVREPIPRGTVVITFDDGYLDAIQHAAPMMQSLKLPGTFYLPTRYIDQGKNQWIDCLYTAFTRRTEHSLSLDGRSKWNLLHTNSHSYRKAYAECARQLLGASMGERQKLLDRISEQLVPSAFPPRLTATWDEIRNCAEQCPLIEFGGHTREHVDLTAIDEVLAQEEIAGSMLDVARELRRPVRHFSFPYGRSCTSQSIWIAQQGWSSGVADGDPVLIRQSQDRYRLPRLDTKLTTEQLAFWTSGLICT